MYLIKLIGLTYKKEKAAILLFFISSIITNLYYLLLYEKDFEIYPLILSLVFFSVYYMYKMYVYHSLYKYLKESTKSPDYKGADKSIYNDIFDYIKDIHDDYLNRIETIKVAKEQKENLIIEWIHNMKTSVSVISLAVSKLEDSEAKEDIYEENILMEKNLQGALNIFRIDDFKRDYLIETINLHELVKECINSEKRGFIYNKVYPKVAIPKEMEVISDRKWTAYIIKQIISNSIKYSKENGNVEFFVEEDVLHTKDYGIGIKESEVNRIFEAFYTGSNGRRKGKSTGIGLYMCKKICENINIDIELKSKEDAGTEVMLKFKTLQ